ncbi:energy-coupling factor ABC transporter permease [candidate division KSB1 bacterium]
MHIPDGLLQPEVIATTAVLSAVTVSVAVKKSGEQLDDSTIPMVGIMSAFLFIAQMIQFPVGPGISGHMLGGALMAILAGPWIASIVLTTVLLIQCIVFQDGGLLALGANILNMAVIGVFSGYLMYSFMRKLIPGAKYRPLAISAAAFVSVILPSAAAGYQLGISGVVPLLPGMIMITSIHVLIGIGEAVITVFAVTFIEKSMPDVVRLRVKQTQ